MTSTYTLYRDDTPTIKIDDWELQAVDRGTYAFIKIDSIIVHHCSKVHTTGNWKTQEMVIVQEHQLQSECSYCGRSAPDEIQALWRLQNMDNL